MFKRLLLTATCVSALVAGSFMTPDTAEAWRWRRPYYRSYYGRPVYYRPYPAYYPSPYYYNYGRYYGGPDFYYGPGYRRGGVWFRF